MAEVLREASVARHRDIVTYQTRTRYRVRDLAEVYTHEREVTSMLDLVPDMFPSERRPRDIGRTFLEPACGAGNFLVAILDRKLAYVRYGRRYRSVTTFEAAVLKALSSIYGIDIDPGNVKESRRFLKADVAHHVNLQPNTTPATDGFWSAVDAILTANIICADTLAEAQNIVLIEYHWQPKAGYVIREWCRLEEPDAQGDLFDQALDDHARDAVPLCYSLLADNPNPVEAKSKAQRSGGSR